MSSTVPSNYMTPLLLNLPPLLIYRIQKYLVETEAGERGGLREAVVVFYFLL